jgi:DNA (cytosine-5)-methyltransferase 1
VAIDYLTMNILDLFSGIGGFSLGLEKAGMETVAFCEKEEYCQKILIKNFPNRYVFSDIKELSFANGNAKYKGRSYPMPRIDLVCGGFPCQPFSTAGKQRATEDDRDLWPEMFRVIREIRPTWVIGENVAGFLNLGFSRTKINLESIGYSLLPFEIPACAVGARHERKRVWIIAHLNSEGIRDKQKTPRELYRKGEARPSSFSENWTTPHTDSNGQSCEADAPKEEDHERIGEDPGWPETSHLISSGGSVESELVRAIHGLSPKLDKIGERHRRQRVSAFGNTVVPQITEITGKAIMEIGL